MWMITTIFLVILKHNHSFHAMQEQSQGMPKYLFLIFFELMNKFAINEHKIFDSSFFFTDMFFCRHMVNTSSGGKVYFYQFSQPSSAIDISSGDLILADKALHQGELEYLFNIPFLGNTRFVFFNYAS